MTSPLSLSEFNALVRQAVELTLPEARWLAAEVSELRTAQNGHCYLELVEKDSHGRGLLAKASAHVWRNTWPLLRMHFEAKTGQRLAPGMKILILAEAEFHELYGYSLNIVDIDPAYTLGDMAQRRQEILRQLEADGVLTLNKELSLPRLVQHIAVISSPSAAGYGDFLKQLADSPFRFEVELFPATMQGDGVEQSIIDALDAINRRASETGAPPFACVLILRGGGAVSDLQGFESYALAANVAQFPLPVLTGIGHERDDTVIDLVAHTRLKTPTAAAAFLIERMQAALREVETAEETIYNNVCQRLQRERHRFDLTARRLQLAATLFAGHGREQLLRLQTRTAQAAQRQLESRRAHLQQLADELPRHTSQRLLREEQRLTLIEKSLQMASPERILRLGYSITTHRGRVLRSPADVQPGDIVETRLADGTIQSRVEGFASPKNEESLRFAPNKH